jgi:hypothetical protein
MAAAPGARSFSPASATLFKPMPAVRYTQASDTSVLGNRVWVARNQPYGGLISYILPQAIQEGVEIAIKDASGRDVLTFRGPGAAGLNRAVWNLSESSSCPPITIDQAAAGRGRGRGRGGRGGGGGTWVRAIPGQYTVRLTAAGQTLEQPLTVRPDPRIKTSAEDMQAWLTSARTIERTECTLDRATADLAVLERRLNEMASQPNGAPAQVESLRKELRPIVLALRGDSRDPGHVNLPGRINWLTIQVGNYSGRPTAAQAEWIATYAKQTEAVVAALEAVKGKIR